jgi:type I restriction enzyme M protein
MPRTALARGSKQFATQQSLNGAIKSICDVMRRSNCAGAMQYVPELTWILFLRILDERETREADEAEAVGASFSPSLAAPTAGRTGPPPGALSGPRSPATGPSSATCSPS